jgi:hypothetical protein
MNAKRGDLKNGITHTTAVRASFDEQNSCFGVRRIHREMERCIACVRKRSATKYLKRK